MNLLLKSIVGAGAILALTLSSHSSVVFYTSGSLSGGDVPDDGSPLTCSHSVSGSMIPSIAAVRVLLDLSGNPAGDGWAGDIVVTLNYNLGPQTAVLLNRVGRTGGNPAGFGFDGWDVSLSDTAPNPDIHNATPTLPATILTGEWEPDGRLVPESAARNNMLSVFLGQPADGDWYLTVSDLSPGGTMRLNSWGLEITAVPEASNVAVGVFALALLSVGAYRRFAR